MTSIFFALPVKNNVSMRSLFPISTADTLLSLNQRKNTVKNIRKIINISDEHFNILYQSLIDNFVEFVQLLPINNGARFGSLIDDGLLRALLALQLQKNAAEDQELDPLFVYVLFSTALLYNVGFVTNDRTVVISERDGAFVREWLPDKGKMLALDGGNFYRIRYAHGMSTELSRLATPLFAQQLMPLVGRNWIAQDLTAYSTWIALLNGSQIVTNDLKPYFDRANKKLSDELSKDKNIIAVSNIGIREPEETSLGEDFIEWLKKGLDAGNIDINTPNADVHVIDDGLFLEVPGIIQKFCAQSAKNPKLEAVFAQLKKIGFIGLSETSEQLATYVYDYLGSVGLDQLSFAHQSKPLKQEAKHLLRRGVEVLRPCFLSFLLKHHLRLSVEKNFILAKYAKAKTRKKLKLLKRRMLRQQRFEELRQEAQALRVEISK